MKIGILSDIHGNSYALENVLKEAKAVKVEKLFILGDCIGYYHHPDRVFKLLDQWDYEIIKGNHEEILIKFLKEDEAYRKKILEKYGNGHMAAVEKLSPIRIIELCELPIARTLSVEDCKIIMSHGSPRSVDEYIYPDSPIELLNQFDTEGIHFVFMGHTHYPFVYNGKHTLIVNAGSVGQSRVNGGIANWGVLDTNNKTFIQKHTFYNTTKLIEELSGFGNTPDYLINVLTRNKYE